MKIFFTLHFSLFTFLIFAQTPVANFTIDKVKGCPPFIAKFFNASTNAATKLSWDFGNGITRTGPTTNLDLINPVISYLNSGTYTVTLTATNASGSNTIVKKDIITVFKIPTSEFVVDTDKGCRPLSVVFSDISTPGDAKITGWNWDFGNLQFSNSQFPAVQIFNTGIYPISLTTTDANGCTDIETKPAFIDVKDKPLSGFTGSVLQACSPPLNVSFVNSSTPASGLTYLWDFGNAGTSSALNPPAQDFTENHNYTVSLIVTNANGCRDTLIKKDYIKLSPLLVGFTALDTSGCSPFKGVFSGTSSSPVESWAWDFGDGTTSTLQSPTNLFVSSGTFTTKLMARTALNCSSFVEKSIVVHPKPVASFSTDLSESCYIPFPVKFSNTTPNASSFQWDINHIGNLYPATYSTNTFTHNYTSPGKYNISLIVGDINGCSDTLVEKDKIEIVLPKAGFSTNVKDGCIPLPVVFSDRSFSKEPIESWTWDFGDGDVLPPDSGLIPTGTHGGRTTGTFQNPIHTFGAHSATDTGVYVVKLIITNNKACTSIFKDSIKTGIPPVTGFKTDFRTGCHPLTVNFTDTSSKYTDEWTWDFGNTKFAETPEFKTTYTDTGFFNVILKTKFHGCSSSADSLKYIYVKYPKSVFSTNTAALCKEQTPYKISFNNTTKTRSLGNTWYWNFGDTALGVNNTSSDSIPDTVSYSTTGEYLIKLKVFNAITGCSDSTTKIIKISKLVANFSMPDTVVCLRQSIGFKNLSSELVSSVPITDWFWDFGDGTRKHATPPFSYTYLSADTFYVKLVVKNELGCKDSIPKVVIVRPLPKARFGTNVLFGCTPLTVFFSDSSKAYDGATISHLGWDLNNDGAIDSITSKPSFVFNSSGNHKTGLVVKDSKNCSSDIFHVNISVTKPMPVTKIPDNVCGSTGVSFLSNGTSGIGLHYLWKFGDGDSSLLQTASHTYDVDTSTKFHISLSLTDTNGCFNSALDSITISKPVASYHPDTTYKDCPGAVTLVYNASSSDVISWTYIFNDGSAPLITDKPDVADTISHVYRLAGTYPVKLIVSNQMQCVDSNVVDSIRIGGPSATFDFTPKFGCAPLLVDFNVINPKNIKTYLWEFNDGDTSNAKNIQHTFTLAGNFSPLLIIRDSLNCEVALITDTDILIKGPILGFTSDKDTVCTPTDIKFTNVTSVPNGVTITDWTWDFGDGKKDSVQNPAIHFYTNPGDYSVKLGAATTDGCSYSLIREGYISVFIGPGLNTNFSPSEGCQPLGVKFNVDTNNVPFGISAVNWLFANGDSNNLVNPYYIYENSGTYAPRLAVSFRNGCTFFYPGDSAILVHPKPIVTFGIEPIVQGDIVNTMSLTNTGIGAISYNWNFGDGNSSHEENPTHTYSNKGIYPLQLIATSQYGCLDTAINDVEITLEITIPNVMTPNGDGDNDLFQLKVPGTLKCLDIFIFDRWGKKIYKNSDYKNDWDGKDMEGNLVNPDIYFYTINYCDKLSWNGWISVKY